MTPRTSTRYVPKYVRRRVRHSLVYLVLFMTFMAAVVGVYKGGVHLVALKPEQITIGELPYALMLSLGRMTASYLASLVFAFVLGLPAARSALGERLIIPLLDILQSVPVVAFFPAAIMFFIGVSHGHRIGIEMAASFLIFTSQAWNMAFAVYEATKTIPQDNMDAIGSFGVRGSQKFWKLYAPACVPRLVYNSILSWSNGWFFLVACEIIAVGPVHYDLPGIGSFLARAAEQDQLRLVLWGLAALSVLILGLDVLIWRPASAWAERFRQDFSTTESHPVLRRTAMQDWLTRMGPIRGDVARMGRVFLVPWVWTLREVVLPLVWDLPAAIGIAVSRQVYARYALPALSHWERIVKRARWINLVVLWGFGSALGLWAGRLLFHWLQPPWPAMAREIPLAVLYSTLRLIVALLLSLAWILPLSLLTWNRPRIRQTLSTIAQVGASLPAIALFPLIIVLVVRRFGGGMEAASILLLITGMQWYILFNCLGGAAIIPADLEEATRSLGLSRWQTWRRLVLPAMRPSLITGAITAWGGGWNALVVSEYVSYKDQILTVNGIGSLLNKAVYQLGDNRAITLCVMGMVGWILVINALVWRPLYHSAAERYKFDA